MVYIPSYTKSSSILLTHHITINMNMNMNMGSSRLEIKEAVLVTPSDPTPTHLLHLSALDSQLFLRFTIEYLLLYTPPHTLDRNSIVARIKSALARALVPYYPLAGRVRARPDAEGLEVVCRAQGAVFVQALCAHTTLSDFERAPQYVTQWRKLLSLQVADVLKGAPPLVVQLTWLADGGAALGIGFNHCLCDGIGSAQFLKLFAELATESTKCVTQPVWERHLLDPVAYGLPVRSSHTEFNRVSDLCGFLSRFTHKRLTPTSVTFDKKSLTELKKLTSGEFSNYTSFEVLSAHVWRSWANSLNLPPDQTLKLLFSIDIRNRVKPGLPTGYYGNAIVLGCAETSSRELAESSLGQVVDMVRRAKDRVGDEYVKEVVESVSGNGRASPDSVGVLIMSQWSKLGLERIDFGMGEAVHVGPICSDRYCLMVPVYGNKDGVKVMVAVPNYAVDKYLYLLRTTNSTLVDPHRI